AAITVKERRYETNQWKTRRQRDLVDARAGVQSRAIGQAALTCVRGRRNAGATARPARRGAPGDRPGDRPRARRSLRVARHDGALEPQALRFSARHGPEPLDLPAGAAGRSE